MDEKYAGQIRHALGALGGAAVAFGLVSPDEVQTLTETIITGAGAVATLAAMVWSWIAKIRASQKAESPVRKEGGFVRLPVVFVLAALMALAFLPGCGNKPVQSEESKAACLKVRPSAVCQAESLIGEGYAMLISLNTVIEQNVDAKVWTKSQAQEYLDSSRAARKKLDSARELLRLGDVAGAASQAQLIKRVLLELQQKIAAQARRST